MNNKPVSDKELNALLNAAGMDIEDQGFSAAVMARIRRRSVLVSLIPAVSAFVGALISINMLPENWIPSSINRLLDPLFGSINSHSSETLMLLASYGIEPSLFWLFLVVPLFILPFALHQE